ncbi:diguanylate cyclase [Yokenella regensburgei]|uniref:sensor domain-containing diguanylate cyclase n=1 Tax=Yokenella regensburgei TaxID=158877 RepID=UPI003F16A2F4
MYLMRILGTFLCFFPILSVLIELNRPLWLLVLLGLNAFIWPTVAFARARQAATPLRAEHDNLVMDAAAGGFWIAMMAANPLPSVVIATILISDRLSAGGSELMRKAALTMVAAFCAGWIAQGMEIAPVVTQRTMFATLPLIAVYMVALSVLTDTIAVKLRFKSRELERIAMMDPLLDIANRRLLEQRIQFELDQFNQAPLHAALISIDIDNFKEVNDRFGHEAGDALLVSVSHVLHAATRKTDTPARLGGDEFVILMPNTTRDEAMVVATRILEATAHITVKAEHSFRCTLSIGIAVLTPGMYSVPHWLKAADDALYRAKRQGKNQIYAH